MLQVVNRNKLWFCVRRNSTRSQVRLGKCNGRVVFSVNGRAPGVDENNSRVRILWRVGGWVNEYGHGVLNGSIQIRDTVLKILGHLGDKPPQVETTDDTCHWAEEECRQNDKRIGSDLSVSKHKFDTPCVVAPSVFPEDPHQVVPPPVAVDDKAFVHVRHRRTHVETCTWT
jgi:hypothetical protein